ncbi:shikimate 5-dehydrogenase [Pseudomonas cavernicola]|uniref:Shikimate 5-dehydrogenase n=1 Tax=Pseudomonas cavernicola TaxID=2320866 RepID=A0A418X998_9PSED|nr:shikimate 5-dehydrogenase [Pseudomonas cavernicola]RJG09065.1 shikimate 5-dehydrogenase [Pseudomonas cavernicola]
MPRALNKDTRLCMSLSGRPGNFGTRFHNFLYEALGLDYVYKAFTTRDLAAAIGGIRALGIHGCAISMPFKETCIQYLDELDPSAAVIQSVNTMVADDARLKGYNTDYIAVASLLRSHCLDTCWTFALRGSGGMAKAVAYALRDSGFRSGFIVARNEAAGRALADACGYDWVPELGELRPELLVNVTPIGMQGGPEAETLAFEADAIACSRSLFDVVAIPVETPLIRFARELGKPVITGAQVIVLQAVEQFVLYTGIRPDAETIDRAAVFARC